MTSNVTDGVLTVTSDTQGDRIVVICSPGGEVRINGSDPDTGDAACSAISTIEVQAGDGNDFVSLRQVDPTAFSSLALVSMDAGTGADVVRGSSVADSIEAGDGNDHIGASVQGGDTVHGGAGIDDLETTVTGDVQISDTTFTFGAESIEVASIERVTMIGGDSAETIDAREFTGTLRAVAHAGDDQLFGGSGSNVLNAGPGNDRVIGGPDRDSIITSDGDDVIHSGAGGNEISAGNGDDVIVGGPDRDHVVAGAGKDEARTLGGPDAFTDTEGNDRFEGGPGDDTFLVGVNDGGRNTFIGGEGRDTLQVYTGGLRSLSLSDTLIRADTFTLMISSIDLAYAFNPDAFESLRIDATAFSGDTKIDGSLDDDVLLGGSGRDEIDGSDGDDELTGGPGADTLDGGKGTDSCEGGPGRDRITGCE